MANLIDKYDLSADEPEDFNTSNHNRADFFLKSAWKMKPFFEDDARDAQGNLIVAKD